MNLRICRLLAISALVSGFLASPPTLAQNAYITNAGSNTVSVIDTVSNMVTKTITNTSTNTYFNDPGGVAVTPDGRTVYVTNSDFLVPAGTVSVIDTATNTVTATIAVGSGPNGVAVSPDSSKVYVV